MQKFIEAKVPCRIPRIHESMDSGRSMGQRLYGETRLLASTKKEEASPNETQDTSPIELLRPGTSFCNQQIEEFQSNQELMETFEKFLVKFDNEVSSNEASVDLIAVPNTCLNELKLFQIKLDKIKNKEEFKTNKNFYEITDFFCKLNKKRYWSKEAFDETLDWYEHISEFALSIKPTKPEDSTPVLEINKPDPRFKCATCAMLGKRVCTQVCKLAAKRKS